MGQTLTHVLCMYMLLVLRGAVLFTCECVIGVVPCWLVVLVCHVCYRLLVSVCGGCVGVYHDMPGTSCSQAS